MATAVAAERLVEVEAEAEAEADESVVSDRRACW